MPTARPQRRCGDVADDVDVAVEVEVDVEVDGVPGSEVRSDSTTLSIASRWRRRSADYAAAGGSAVLLTNHLDGEADGDVTSPLRKVASFRYKAVFRPLPSFCPNAADLSGVGKPAESPRHFDLPSDKG